MAENVTLARPYAEAAFALAKGTDPGAAANLQTWSQALNRLATMAASDDMRDCITDPRFSPEQLSSLFVGLAGNDLTADQKSFIRVLVDNDRSQVLPEIAGLFDELKNGYQGVREANVESAFPMGEAALKDLVGALEKKFDCKIQAAVNVNPELIGGVRIAVGDEVIDASVRGKLAAMASALKN